MSKKKDDTLEKCNLLIDRLKDLKKALGAVNVASTRKPMNTMGAGWSMDTNTGAFHHSTHGVISTFKNPDGQFDIKHGGKVIGNAGDIPGAGKHILDYIKGLAPKDTGMTNIASDPTAKSDEDEEDVEKSGYGKFKGGSQYSAADNAKRKMRNTSETAGQGPNVNVKAYSSKPGQLSAKQQVAVEAAKAKRLSGPVKQFTPEQIAAANEARKLKKTFEEGPWNSHANIPSADDEVIKVQKENPVQIAENIMANQLANVMLGRAMLGNPAPRQPTDQEMFGHLVPKEEEIQKAEAAWGNKLNWLEEAIKPISSRFASEEEELAYWSGIKVSDKDDNKAGY
jgi:hypothetical protein